MLFLEIEKFGVKKGKAVQGKNSLPGQQSQNATKLVPLGSYQKVIVDVRSFKWILFIW